MGWTWTAGMEVGQFGGRTLQALISHVLFLGPYFDQLSINFLINF